MTMLEKAIKFLASHPDQTWSLGYIRQHIGIAIRSQYRLSEQLKDDPRVDHLNGNIFQIRGA